MDEGDRPQHYADFKRACLEGVREILESDTMKDASGMRSMNLDFTITIKPGSKIIMTDPIGGISLPVTDPEHSIKAGRIPVLGFQDVKDQFYFVGYKKCTICDTFENRNEEHECMLDPYTGKITTGGYCTFCRDDTIYEITDKRGCPKTIPV